MGPVTQNMLSPDSAVTPNNAGIGNNNEPIFKFCRVFKIINKDVESKDFIDTK